MFHIHIPCFSQPEAQNPKIFIFEKLEPVNLGLFYLKCYLNDQSVTKFVEKLWLVDPFPLKNSCQFVLRHNQQTGSQTSSALWKFHFDTALTLTFFLQLEKQNAIVFHEVCCGLLFFSEMLHYTFSIMVSSDCVRWLYNAGRLGECNTQSKTSDY